MRRDILTVDRKTDDKPVTTEESCTFSVKCVAEERIGVTRKKAERERSAYMKDPGQKSRVFLRLGPRKE